MTCLNTLKITVVLSVCLLLAISSTVWCINSEAQVNALDAAVQTMINDETFKTFYRNLLFFSVPPCTPTSGTGYTKVDYPKTNPFAGRTSILLCMESGAIYPLYDIKIKVGETIVQNINKQYSISLKAEWKFYNTSQLGFFPTMRNAVDTKEC